MSTGIVGNSVELPDQAYLVCATPRSGSTLLCELLSATGVAGRPQEYFEDLQATSRPRQPRQYFDGLDAPEVLELLAPAEPGVPRPPGSFARRFPEILREGTTPNGVFGAKLMWGYLPDLLLGVREIPEASGRRAPEALAAAFPRLRYVQVLRRDKVGQAVSLWTAVQTAQWRDDGDGPHQHEPEYAYRAIDHLVEQLTAQERAWTRWFANAGLTPVTVVYEDLAATQRAVVGDVLDALGLERADVAEPPMRRQAGGRSLEWATRYQAERSGEEAA
ncbi:MAG: trehalose 2-sulfotransferase [Solirubrobacteraceae bacterium]|nr:trehalose 2-sulfotransferase [Solirubrobacteraceae bacterium]